MLSSIVVAVAVAILVLIADSLLLEVPLPFTKNKNEDGEVVSRNGFEFESESLVKALIIGAAIGAVNFLSPKATGGMLWLAPVLLAVALAVTVYLVWWWSEEGSDIKELIPFVLLTLIIYPTTMSAAVMTASLCEASWLATLTQKLPLIAAVGSGAFYLANLCFFSKEEAEADGNEKKAKNFNLLGWVIVALALLALVVSFFNLGWGKSNLSSSQSGRTFPFYYNSLLQNDGDEANDYDFGPSLAQLEVMDGKVQNGDTVEYTVEDYDADYRERGSIDPAAFVAFSFYTDMVTGSDLYKDYRIQYPDPMSAMNAAIHDFNDDEALFKEYQEVFFERLDKAEVSLKSGKNIKDQMYMNPYTLDGIPEVVVYETLQDDGLFLVYTYNIKGNKVDVVFRVDCGYQPTDVAELFGVEPEKHPQKPTNPKPSEPTPTKPTDPTPTDPTPTDPTPTDPTPTEPSNPKDPSKGTQGSVVGPNDVSGRGPNTNNGKGAQYSSEQTDDGSVFLPTYDDYQDTIDDLEEINDNQKEAGDKNTPSYKPPESSDTKVDNDAGNGWGDIDDKPAVSKPVTDGNGDKVTDDGFGEADWGTPPN